MVMTRAQTIQVFLPGGDPAGIRVASITTRTVRVFDVPRTLLPLFLAMPEAAQVSVYFLLGQDEDLVAQGYIGQTGEIGKRLQQHAQSKDFWTRAMIAVSLTNEWTSTHAAFLEWLSISRAQKAGRYALLNGNQASNPHTPAPLEADCHEFLDTIAVLLATLGAPILEPTSNHQPAQRGVITGANQELYFREAGCEARGRQALEGFLVLAGSKGRSVLRPSAPASVAYRRAKLTSEGVIRAEGDVISFLLDHTFPSPSTAGQVLVGGTVNGRTAWKDVHGRNLNDLEQDDLGLANAGMP